MGTLLLEDEYDDYDDARDDARDSERDPGPKEPESYNCDHCRIKGSICEYFSAEDQGIGRYEYGGAPGVDVNWQPLCEHPDSESGDPREECPIKDQEENYDGPPDGDAWSGGFAANH